MKKLVTLFVFLIFYPLAAQDAGKETNEDSFMKVRVRVQTRAMAGEKGSNYASVRDYDAVDFNFRRLRVGFIFQGDDWYGGILDLRVENLLAKPALTSTNTLTNAYSAVELANVWIATSLPESRFTFGQYKLPFFREGLATSANLITPERAYANSMIQLYDIGIMYELNPLGFIDSMAHKLKFYLSVTNGEGAGDQGVGRTNVQASNPGEPTAPLWNARLEYNPLGGPSGKGWKEGMEIFTRDILLSFGVSGMYTPSAEYGKFANNLSVGGVSADSTMFFKGLYISGAFTTFMGEAANSNLSYQGTIGYAIPFIKQYMMPAFRYDYFEHDADGDSKVRDAEKFQDFWVGINYYFVKHTLKAQVFYLIRRDSAAANGGDVRDNAVYFQLQMDFGKKIF